MRFLPSAATVMILEKYYNAPYIYNNDYVILLS